MTKTYALKRLLEHGPMTGTEIVYCTCWARTTAFRVIDKLIESGDIRRINGRGFYLFEAV